MFCGLEIHSKTYSSLVCTYLFSPSRSDVHGFYLLLFCTSFVDYFSVVFMCNEAAAVASIRAADLISYRCNCHGLKTIWTGCHILTAE